MEYNREPQPTDHAIRSLRYLIGRGPNRYGGWAWLLYDAAGAANVTVVKWRHAGDPSGAYLFLANG